MIKRGIVKTSPRIIDFSLILLIISNLVTIYLVYENKIHFYDVVFIYFFQALIFTYFMYRRIFVFNKIISSKNKKVISEIEKQKLANSFLYIQKVFFISFSIFLIAPLVHIGLGTNEHILDYLTPSLILINSIIFLINHTFSFYYNKENDKLLSPSTHKVIFLPISRSLIFVLFPYILILFIWSESTAIIGFIILKTFSDVIIHIAEHRENSSST